MGLAKQEFDRIDRRHEREHEHQQRMQYDEQPGNDGQYDEWTINELSAMPATHGT